VVQVERYNRHLFRFKKTIALPLAKRAISLAPSAIFPAAAYDPQPGCPQLHRSVMNFRESSHCIEQYLLPGCAMQLQPSFAHFWGVLAIAGPSEESTVPISDAVSRPPRCVRI
jgi:hypothetical protein